MKLAPACVALLVLSAVAFGSSQDPALTPVFPARSDLVRLDLIVRDKSGRRVEDLRKDEIQVLEDGKPCAIESFRLVQAEGTARAPRAPEVPSAAAAPHAARADEGLVSVVALVFDQLGPEAAKNARAAALELAGRSFPKGSVFAVFKIGRGLGVLQSFTENRAALPAAIERATTGVDRARDPAAVNPQYDNATEEAFAIAKKASEATGIDAKFLAMEARMLRFTDRVTRETEGQASLQPLLAIAQGLSPVQGRKSLLYFSEGLAVPQSIEEVFRSTISAANRANVSVYAFDARGLRVRSPSEETKAALDLSRSAVFAEEQPTPVAGGATPQLESTGASYESVLAPETAADAIRLNRQGVLGDLAASTGGFLIAETNDLRPGLERVMADLRSYYDVGYVPTNPKADGKWRAIEVKVARPGVVVRARRGYLALPPGALVVLPRELPLAEALAASPMPRDVDVRAATLRFPDASSETETLVWVEVPLAGVSLTRGDTTYHGELSLLGQVKDEKGALVARLSHDAEIEGPIAEIDAARERTSVVKRTLRLPPGRYVLETAVQDRVSGRLGARRTAFEIPPPAPALSIGSVAIVRADDVASAPPAPEDPLRAGALRATPLLGRSFPEGTPAVSLLLSLYAAPAAVRPEVELEFRKDGQAVAHAKPELPAPGADGRITYVGSFPTGGLGAGRYEVWVRGRVGDAEATEATAFTITPRVSQASAVAASGSAPAAASVPGAPSAAAVAGGAGSIEDKSDAATPLATVLERAGRFVREYETTFSNLVAEESYRQWAPDPRGVSGPIARTLRSDLVFVHLSGPLPWGTFRDVYEVDGSRVRDRERRLEKLFFAPKASDYEQAEAILRESSRYNLVRAYRDVNSPILGLLFLLPQNQPRLAFRRKGTRTIAGFPTVEVVFEEKVSPTLVHDRWNNDVPARGRFWIDETRGTVLRTETEFDLEAQKTSRDLESWERGFVATEYRFEPALRCFVPDTMSEMWDFWGVGRVDGRARYDHYRRFDVSVGTASVLPLAYGKGATIPDTNGWSPPPNPPTPPPAPEEPAAEPLRPAPQLEMVPAAEPPGAVGSLLQKAGDYVVRYEQAFRNVVAEERYEQQSSVVTSVDGKRSESDSRGDTPPSTERLRSEVVFTMLPGPVPWILLRDVLEVEGSPEVVSEVRGRAGQASDPGRAHPDARGSARIVLREAGRLAPLFRASPTAALRESGPITRESDRLLVGPARRTIGVPTAALAYLHPDNRDAFVFKSKGRASVQGQEAVEIVFAEVGRLTLNHDGAGGDVPVSGAFFVREIDGAILRSRTELAFDVKDAPRGRYTVTTDYREDPAMGLLVPAEMRESLEWHVEPGRPSPAVLNGPVIPAEVPGLQAPPLVPLGTPTPGAPGVDGSIEGRAKYSGFRSLAPGAGR